MASRAPDNVAELVPGRLYAVSGFVPADRDTSWIPRGLRGTLAVSCYVLRDGDEALLVDTGLGAHREEITSGLAAVFAGTSARAMIMTRREPDSIINLPWLVQRFGLGPVYCGGALNPLDFFERVDEQNAQAHVSAIARSDIAWLRPGMGVTVGSLAVDVLRTRLCVLPKTHLFERATGTLFGSDSWGSLPQDAGSRVAVVDGSAGRPGTASIDGHLRHKFDWLLGIDTSSVADDVLALAALPVRRICSATGAVVEGAELCRSVILETAEAIRRLSREPMRDRLRGFDCDRLARAAA